MHIAILDQENNRVIISEVPDYLTSLDRSSEEIAEAIFNVLGLSSPEYMIGEFKFAIDVASLNSGKGYGENTRTLEECTSNFKEDVLSALEESKDY